MNKLHTAGLVAGAVSLIGLLTRPELLGLLPAKEANVIAIVGLVLQAITKGIQQGGTDLVPKEPKDGGSTVSSDSSGQESKPS